MDETTCYMCDAIATTKEHIPPKSVFPKQKDLLGEISLRKKLITVPSCERLNNCKSMDDEYLVFCLATCFHDNDIKDRLFNTKIMRAIDRPPDTYSDFLANYQKIVLKHPNGVVEYTGAYTVDIKRFDSAISHIAFGLFFHHTGKKWTGGSIVMTNELRDFTSKKSNEVNKRVDDTIKRILGFFTGKELFGYNPQVFKYQLFDDRPKGFVLLLKFYDAITIVVVLVPNESNDSNILPLNEI